MKKKYFVKLNKCLHGTREDGKQGIQKWGRPGDENYIRLVNMVKINPSLELLLQN